MKLNFSWIAVVAVLVLAFVLLPSLFSEATGITIVLLVSLGVGYYAYLPLKKLFGRYTVMFDVGGVLTLGDTYTEELTEMPGIRSLLRDLHKNYVTVILSNNNSMIQPGFSKKFKYDKYFDYIFYSSKLRAKKPSREIYLRAMQAVGARARYTIFFDDALENVEAARKLGIRGIHFKNASQAREALKQAGLKV